MAIPLIASSITTTTEGSSTTIDFSGKPLGIENGDLLLLLVGNENSANGEGFDTLTGWTLEFNYGSGTSDSYLGLYSRIATGDALEDSPIVPTLGNDDGHGWYLRVTGVNATDPIRVVGASQVIASANTVTVTALTTGTNTYSLAVSAMAFDGSDSDPVTETGTGWTFKDFLESPIGTDAGGASSGSYSTKNIDTASTGTLDSVINMGGGQSDGIAATMFIIAGDETPPPTFEGSSSIISNSSVTAEGIFAYDGKASVSSSSTVDMNGQITQDSSASIYSSTSVDAYGLIVHDGKAPLVNLTTLSVEGLYYLTGVAPISGSSFVSCNGYGLESGVASILSTSSLISFTLGNGCNMITSSFIF